MIRNLKGHVVEDDPAPQIRVQSVDEPGPGGAHHRYEFTSPEGIPLSSLSFQNGPIAEVGLNGVSNESVLMTVIDRLQSFQEGPYACIENANALGHLANALHWMQDRTKERLNRQVEGTSQR